MRRVKWYYIINILLSYVLLTTAVACDQVALPERATPPEGLPVINEFYADPDEVMAAESAVLHWNVSGASTVTIEPNVGEVTLSGERSVAPLENTTYILTASNDVGSVTALTEVIGSSLIATVVEGSPSEEVASIEELVDTDRLLIDPTLASTQELPSTDLEAIREYPTIHYFTADPESIWEGGVSRLRYEVSNADWIEVGPFDGRVIRDYRAYHGVGGAELWDSWVDVRPNTTKIYYLTAFNRHEGETLYWARQSVTVTIEQPSTIIPVPEVERIFPTINYFNADPSIITEGDSSTLSWDVSNADLIQIYSTWIENVRLYRDEDPEVSSSGSMPVTPPYADYTETYRLTATNSAGSVSASVTVTVEEKSKPDLVITDIWRSGSATWYYTIKNQGSVECKSSISTLVIDGTDRKEQNMGSLAPSESREMFFSYDYTCVSGTTHTWSVVADANSDIDESDENNNTRQEKTICPK